MKRRIRRNPRKGYRTDVLVINEGSMIGLLPQSAAAKEWFNENVQAESWQYMGKVLYVDHRFASDLISGIEDAGMSVRSMGKNPRRSRRYKRNPRMKDIRRRDVPLYHQLRIARMALKTNDVFNRVLGGPTQAEAREILRRHGFKRNPHRVEVWRRPTKSEIKFGYGTLHRRFITVSKPPRGGQKFKLDGKTWTYGSKRG